MNPAVGTTWKPKSAPTFGHSYWRTVRDVTNDRVILDTNEWLTVDEFLAEWTQINQGENVINPVDHTQPKHGETVAEWRKRVPEPGYNVRVGRGFLADELVWNGAQWAPPPAVTWTNTHRVEASARTYELAAQLHLEGAYVHARAMADAAIASEEDFRFALIHHGNFDLKRVRNEIRRVRDLAEGRRVRKQYTKQKLGDGNRDIMVHGTRIEKAK